MLDIRPEYANLVAEDGSVTKIAPAQVQLGEVIKIKPGERVPLDGKVISGSAYLDTAALTGESEPRIITLRFKNIDITGYLVVTS